MRYIIQSRERREVNTDPQRRCYNGCHFSSKWVWSDWCDLTSAADEKEAEESLANWRLIGRSTCEFRAVPAEAS